MLTYETSDHAQQQNPLSYFPYGETVGFQTRKIRLEGRSKLVLEG